MNPRVLQDAMHKQELTGLFPGLQGLAGGPNWTNCLEKNNYFKVLNEAIYDSLIVPCAAKSSNANEGFQCIADGFQRVMPIHDSQGNEIMTSGDKIPEKCFIETGGPGY